MKLVSVIIPTFSRPKFLPRAIESVLAQDYDNIEIIIVDDNGIGTDNQLYTERLVLPYIINRQIIYLKHHHNMNASAARNTGLTYSRGDYIAFLDDDDEFLPSKIRLQVQKLDHSNHDIGGCYCNWIWKKGDKVIKKNRHVEEGNLADKMLLLENVICGGSSLLLKREVCIELNGFDETFYRHQDWEFLIRYFRKYLLLVVDEIVLIIHVEDRVFTHDPDVGAKLRLYYMSKFEKDISASKYSDKICMTQYFMIGLGYFNVGRFFEGLEWLKKACNYHHLGIMKIIHCIYIYSFFYMNKFPLISVAIPFYNAESFLKHAILSVLNQTYKNLEILLIDDGSTDSSLVIAESFYDQRIKVVSDGVNRGLIYRLNQSVNIALGEYYARMDADDIMHPDRLATQIEYLLKYRNVDVLGTSYYSIDASNKIRQCIMLEHTCNINNMMVLHPSILAKKTWFQQNPYDIRYYRVEDTELWLRTFSSSKIENLSIPLMFYREYGVPTWRKYIYSQIFSLKLYSKFFTYNRSITWSAKNLLMVIAKIAVCTFLCLIGRMDKLISLRKRNVVDFNDDEAVKYLQIAINENCSLCR